MHRHILFAAGLFFAASATGIQAQSDGLKIGYIDSRVIMEQAPGAQEASQQFNQDMEQFRAEVEAMAEQLDSMITQYEQQRLTLSPEARQQREQTIQTRRQEYQQRVTQLDQMATQRQQELAQPIMDRINQVIETMRAEGSYHLIFDVAAGAIIAADPSLNLTDEVIRRLKADTTGASGPAGEGDR